jgi:HEAT repeat protein
MQLTRRSLTVGIGLVVGLVGAALVLREARYLAHLPPPVRARMPAHFRIPFGLAPEVRAGIEGCYARVPEDRFQAAHILGNLGPAAAPAAPWLMALLADEEPGRRGPGPNPAATPTPPSINWSACEGWPLIGNLIRLLRERKDDQFHPPSASEACGALAEIGTAAVEPLVKCLKDELPRVRMYAAIALGNIADPRAIEPLAALLNDPDSRPRMAAALALGEFRDARAVKHLTETLLHTTVKGGECDVREAAATGLAMTGPVGWPSVIAALRAENHDARYAAVVGARAYFESREAGASPNARDLELALLAAMGDPDEEVARWAAYALSKVEDPVVIAGLVAAVNHPSADVRRCVGEALANFDGPKVADALAALLKHPENRERAACLLAKMGDKRALEPLIQIAQHTLDYSSAEVIVSLGALGDPRAVPPLLGVLDGSVGRGPLGLPHAYEADLAASALAQLKDARAIPGLVDACREWPDSTAVRAAVVSFGAQAVEPLLKSLRDEFISVYGPIRALSEIGDRRAVEPLRAMLKGDLPFGREEAAVALVKLGDSQAIEVAFNALRDPDTRLAAVNALGYLRDKRAIGPLRALLAEKAPREDEKKGDETAPDTSDRGELRKATLRALISIGDPDAIVPALEEGIRNSLRTWCMSEEITWADMHPHIPRMGAAALGPLQKALSHPSVSVRAEAASLLFLMDGPEALAALRTTFSMQQTGFVNNFPIRGDEGVAKRTEPLLEILASHKDREVRRVAAEALSKNRDPRVIPALRRAAAGDICPSVRAAAWKALEDLTGEDRPETLPPRWLETYSALGTLLGDDWE